MTADLNLDHSISSVQLLSHVWFFVTPWTAAHQASLSITNSRSLLKLTSIELVMSSNHLILYCPLLLPPSVSPTIPCIAATHVKRVSQQAAKCPRSRSSIHDYQMNKYNEQKPKGVDQWFFWVIRTSRIWWKLWPFSPCTHMLNFMCNFRDSPNLLKFSQGPSSL